MDDVNRRSPETGKGVDGEEKPLTGNSTMAGASKGVPVFPYSYCLGFPGFNLAKAVGSIAAKAERGRDHPFFHTELPGCGGKQTYWDA